MAADNGYSRFIYNRPEYTDLDYSNIDEWVRKRLNSGCALFCLDEAAAFMNNWHPAAYRDDSRKKRIEEIKEVLSSSIDRTGCESVFMGEQDIPFSDGDESYSRRAYYRWSISNKRADCFGSEWFRDYRIADAAKSAPVCPGTRFKRIEVGSQLWREYFEKNAYEILEMAYLICGLVPEEEGENIDERAYNSMIAPVVDQIREKMHLTHFHTTLYGIATLEEDVMSDYWLFDREAMDRFCYNAGYSYIFETESVVPDEEVDGAPWDDEAPEVLGTFDASSGEAELISLENDRVDLESVPVCTGVTVKDIKEMIADAPQLKDVFVALTEWRKEEKPQTRSMLENKLKCIARRKGANLVIQGHDKNGYARLSRAQRDGLDAYFLPVGRAGKKKPYEEWPKSK